VHHSSKILIFLGEFLDVLNEALHLDPHAKRLSRQTIVADFRGANENVTDLA
jgi:hypothetical protein